MFVIYLATLSVAHKVFSGWVTVNNELESMWKEAFVELLELLRPRVLGGVFVSSPSWDSLHCLNLKLDHSMNIYDGASSMTRGRTCLLSDVSVL